MGATHSGTSRRTSCGRGSTEVGVPQPALRRTAAAGNEQRKRHLIPTSRLPAPPDRKPSAQVLEDLQAIAQAPQPGPLEAQDVVTVKEAWNRVIAWKDATMEAMVYRWIQMDEGIYDQIQFKFDELQHDLFQMIDKSVRALDLTTETHHRESYTVGFPGCISRDFGDSPTDAMFHYCMLGIRPRHWGKMKDAFLFALKTHSPYMYEHDKADLDRKDAGALSRFFQLHIVAKANAMTKRFIDELQSPTAVLVQRQALALKAWSGHMGLTFFCNLLNKHPELCDFFPSTDMDAQAKHVQQIIEVTGAGGVQLRDILPRLTHLGCVHQRAMVPSHTYSLMGEVLLETLDEMLELAPGTADFWAFLYQYCATVISAPSAVEERLFADAREFFEQLAKEEAWGASALEVRLKQVQAEIGLCGTYRHTSRELEVGARMAWRNSPKCIGRIAWDTLQVLDRRHMREESEIFTECLEHLQLAFGGGIVKSVMTIFAPRRPNEQWGTRFWNAQFCRYAGYKMADGSVLGDPANVDYTKTVMERFDWKPPAERSPFDPLPVIIQLPDEEPQIFEIPRHLHYEVELMHPDFAGFASLGLKWPALPAISSFNLKLGGIDYPCCPFNGWFVDLEIARNLVERYDVGPRVAKICGLNTSSSATGWRSMVYQIVSYAVSHSFSKKGVTIETHFAVSEKFLTHVDRERSLGREVPAQWSWIGGWAGMHCPVWGYEMRDFYVRPQYHYCCQRWVVDAETDLVNPQQSLMSAVGGRPSVGRDPSFRARNVLILYASSTGKAERFAKKMAAELGLAYKPRVMDLNSMSQQVVEKCTHVLVFASTFNDGEAPQNGDALPERLSFPLAHWRSGRPIKFAVMALGSSAYPKFCAFGKRVDRALEVAGGVRFVNTVLADALKDQGTDFDKFLAGVRNELEPRAAPAGAVAPHLEVKLLPGAGASALPQEVRGHKLARVISTEQLLQTSSADRSTRRIDIDLSAAGLGYTTGDHLSVFPCNPDQEIEILCRELGIPADKLQSKMEAIVVDGDDSYPASLHFAPTTLYNALKWHLDITFRVGNMEDVLSMVRDAGGMTGHQFAELKKTDPEQLKERFWWVSRVLRAFPQAKGKISLGTLMSTLGAQYARLYSCSSSNLVSPGVASLCVGLVSTDGNQGLASGYLHGLTAGSPVWVWAQRTSFVLPQALAAPLIMVGPGTGIGPFRGFWQERQHLLRQGGDARAGPGPYPKRPQAESGRQSTDGQAMLFTGFRSSKEMLFSAELKVAADQGAISTLSVSLSREPGRAKEHVHDAMRRQQASLWQALQDPRCHYYVCGDGRMADSAYEALLHCVRSEAQMSRARAVAFMDQMRAQGRYHVDVWGHIWHLARTDQGRHSNCQPNRAKAWLKIVQGDTGEKEDTPAPVLAQGAKGPIG